MQQAWHTVWTIGRKRYETTIRASSEQLAREGAWLRACKQRGHNGYGGVKVRLVSIEAVPQEDQE